MLYSKYKSTSTGIFSAFYLIIFVHTDSIPSPLLILQDHNAKNYQCRRLSLSWYCNESPNMFLFLRQGILESSCLMHYKKTPQSREEMTFRQRQDILTEDTTLPLRYLSDDGECAIEITVTGSFP